MVFLTVYKMVHLNLILDFKNIIVLRLEIEQMRVV